MFNTKSFGVALVTFCLFFGACRKEKVTTLEETTPSSDPYYSADLQSSKDITTAVYIISDIEMICSFLGENTAPNSFYNEAAGSNTVSYSRNESTRLASMTFNKTTCNDGKKRDGTVSMNFAAPPPPPDVPPPPPGAGPLFTRDAGYIGKISFKAYTVDDWKVELFYADTPMFLFNTLPAPDYNTATTNIVWKLGGKLRLIRGNDTLIWTGTLTKTLENTSDVNVFSSDKKSAIKWNLAKISYSDSVWGLSKGIYSKYAINKTNPLRRDFNCSVNMNPGQCYPFRSGVATYNYGAVYTRTINYGPNNDCDIKGTIKFQDETHEVDFK